MPDVRPDSKAPKSSNPITLSHGLIRIHDEAAFTLGQRDLCTRFVSRVLSIPEVNSVSVDLRANTTSIRHGVDPESLSGFLQRIVSTARGETSAAHSSVLLPPIPAGSSFSIHRFGSTLTTWEVVADEPGRLRLRHEGLRGDPVVATRLEREFLRRPGVQFVAPSPRTGHLVIRYDPSKIAGKAILGIAEFATREPEPRNSASPATVPVKFGMANVSLVVAAAGEFLLPILLPISAMLLIATNVSTFKAARLDLKNKRIGLPSLYLAIILTTLATGQFLASATMTWLFRFWHRRFRVELASERLRLLGDVAEGASMARLMTPTGTEVLVPVGRIQPGDRILVAKGETIPADGKVLVGEGVVDERAIRGFEGISQKGVDDQILAGSSVLAGSFLLEVIRVGEQTRSSIIRKALISATTPLPGSTAPTQRSEAFASKAVGPTLATAGLGFLAGDLMTVGAILRPDYATGPGLAVPLHVLHQVTLSARLGIVAREPEALERLGQVDLFVLEDHPDLSRIELSLAKIQTHLPEPVLLRYATSAYRHLVDDRAKALVSACRDRQIHLLNLEAVEFGRGVTVVHGKHRIRVIETDSAPNPLGPLAIEIDGTVVGVIEFDRSSKLQARSVIDRVRQTTSVPFALISERSAVTISCLAGSLGVEMFQGDFRPEDQARFLAACRSRGLKTAFVGDCSKNPRAAEEAFVSISLDGLADPDNDRASLAIQHRGLAPLADVLAISKAHATRVDQTQKLILVPNLLCVAGAFFFGFTGMTSVMISNLGTLGLYRRASDSLRELDSLVTPRLGQPRRAG